MNTTRRNALLAGGAVIAGMSVGGASSCSTSSGVDPALIDKINAIIASSCNAIGMATTIAAIVTAMFPGLTVIAATAEQLGQIAEAFCKAITVPAASGKYSAKLGGTEIEVHGWIVKDNKVEQF